MTNRGKEKVWKRVLSCFLAFTLAFGTLTFTGKEAEVAKAAENTMSITQTGSAWYNVSSGHANFECVLTGATFEKASDNIFSETFVDQYVRFGGGMTKADFFEGLTYGGLAVGNIFQVKWGSRTRKFGDGWSFTIAQGAPITYNSSAATVTLDREYTFTFTDGGDNCDNYCTPKGYYTNTFKFTMNATFGNGKTGALTNISFDSSTFRARNVDFTTLVNENEEYRDYIAFSKVDFADYTANSMKINYLIHDSYGAVQITDWGDIRTSFENGDQLIFYQGFPVYYTDSEGNACKGLLDHTYVFECIGPNKENDQVFRYIPLDASVPTYGLQTITEETVAQSSTNLEQYINVPFKAECQKTDKVSIDAMEETIAEQYIELSGYTFEEAKDLGIAIRFIPNASVLQLGFSTDAVSKLAVGTTLTLKKGMPVAYDLNGKLNIAILDSDYIFTLREKNGTKLKWENTMHATYALWQKTIAQSEEGDYKMYPMPIVTDAFPDMKAINDLNNRGQGRFDESAWNYLKLSHHSTADLTKGSAHLDWYGYHPEVSPFYQGLRLYSNLTFTDGETMTLKKGLPITYQTTDERTKVITLEKDVIWKWIKAESKWVITDKEAANVRAFELTDIQSDTKANDNTNTWQIYLTPSNPLSEDSTENWYGNGQEYYPVKVRVGEGEAVEVQAKQNSPKSLFLEIPYTVLGKDATTTLTIQAGEYKSSMRDKYWKLNEDYKLYVNKYGWSESGYITGTDEVIPSNLLPEHANSQKNAGFTFGLEKADEAFYNTEDVWDSTCRLQPMDQKKVTDTTLYWLLERGGLYVDGVWHSACTLIKLSDTDYYVPASDFKASGTVGKTYQIKGYYMDKNGKIFHYESPVVKWTGEKWETVIVGLADTGVRYDVNADSSFDSKDLVRLIHYMSQPDKYKVTFNYVDCNFDGASDSKDIGALRRLLLKTFWYDGNDATPYGTPVFDEELTVERLAYVCPSVTKEDGTIFNDAEVDEVFREFKETGLTLLNTEFVATLSDQDTDHESNDALRAYLRGAERNGLGVVVYCVYLEALLKCTEDIDTQFSNWKTIMDVYVTYLKNFPAFRGFVMSDELTLSQASNYQKVATYLRAKYPEVLLFSSQLATYASSDKIGSDYKAYINAFALSSGVFTYDNYGLIEMTGNFSGYLDYSVEDSWFDNLKQVAENSLDTDGNQRYIPGVTIQSFSMPYSANTGHTYRRYATTEKADIGFQMYTALAWGMQSINYFAYGEHPDNSQEGLGDEMLVNPAVKASVTAANSDLATFDHVYKSFTWKNTLDVAKDKTVNTTNNTRLTSAKATGGRAFVGCMQDVYGFDGYMVANAEGPRAGKTATVTLNFTNATKAWVYYNGTKEEVTLSNGTYEKALKAGEGIFVIPIR